MQDINTPATKDTLQSMFDEIIKRCLKNIKTKLRSQLPDRDVVYFERIAKRIISGYRLNFITTNLGKYTDQIDRRMINKCRAKLYYICHHWFINDYVE